MISTRNAKNIIPRNNRNPWSWIPTLYFAEGLPYVAVMTIAVIMYKRLGLSNTEIALYTSWLYLPWTIKPLWSPFVDLVKTKRSWIIAMQGLIAAGFAGIEVDILQLHAVGLKDLCADLAGHRQTVTGAAGGRVKNWIKRREPRCHLRV